MSGTVVLSGSPRPDSRTTGLAVALGTAAARVRGEVPPEVVDLAEFGQRLLAQQDAQVDQAAAVVREADLLVVATPTCAGTFTGVLKVFLDRFPPAGLAGRRALSVLTAGSRGQAETADGYLRALLRELGADTPGPGLTVTEATLADLPLDSLDSLIVEYLDRVRDALQLPSR